MYIKSSLIILTFIGACLLSKAQDSASSQYAIVYFLRTSGAMGLTAFSTFIDDSLACHLHNNKFSIHSVPPGRHKFQVRADGKKPKKNIKTLDIDLKPGQKYYIMVDVTDHYLAGTISLIEITENTSRKMLPKLEEDKNCL